MQRGCRDHPRLCGEKLIGISCFCLILGSPPPMRGKAAAIIIPPLPHGITPAYAGKSDGWSTWDGMAKDHPRLCGEKNAKIFHFLTIEGSPPPMRGKVMLRALESAGIGITPAYAGKSDSEGGMYPQRRDHPRLCGEKAPAHIFRQYLLGSPPPMRGKEPRQSRGVPDYRITPAYAGKRKSAILSLSAYRDHPRLCGEKAKKARQTPADRGSPPPMRGKAQDRLSRHQLEGITPAYAGKRKNPHCKSQGLQDHPRLCGEKCKMVVDITTGSGSPPPMRGKDHETTNALNVYRITPAYAGKSQREA